MSHTVGTPTAPPAAPIGGATGAAQGQGTHVLASESPVLGAAGPAATAASPGPASAPGGAARPPDVTKVTLLPLLRMVVDLDASDLHIAAGTPPQLRIDGALRPIKLGPLRPQDSMALCLSVLSSQQRLTFDTQHEVDLSFEAPGLARFRANIFMERGQVAGAFRRIPLVVKSFGELGLPPALTDIARRPRGLILVTGPTGSGKSTTLAAILDLINSERHGHLILLEDPIEYLHQHKRCVVVQREIGTDSLSFATGLRNVLRQDPDVVFIGELRDQETMEAALTISETGRLALATLHTNSTVQTMARIVGAFPAAQKEQIRMQLSMSLQAVLCQQLVPRIGGGRALALEILIPNAAVRNLIREDKTHQIYSILQTGRARTGMQSLNQSLADLVLRRVVTLEDALMASSDHDELRELVARPIGAGAAPPRPPK